MLSLLVALALSQNTATMAGIPPRPLTTALDYTQSVLFLSTPTLCDGSALTTDQAGAVSVTRATNATCQGSDGLYQLGSNVPVVEADGLRVQPASSNRVADSVDFGTWSTFVSTTLVSDGESDPFNPGENANSARKITSTVNGGYNQSPSFTITATSAVASVFARTSSGTQAYNFILRDTTAGVDRCTGSGTATTSWPSMKSRASCSSGAIVSGNSHVLRIYPGGTAGTGTIVFSGPQVEPSRTVMTSYITTSGGAATRNSDNVSFTTTSNTAAGCASAYTTFTADTGGRILSTGNGDVISSSDTTHLFANDGSTTITSPAVTNLVGRTIWAKTQWTGSTFKIYAETVGNVTSGTFDGSLGATTYYIGSNQSVVQWLDGWITKIKVSTDPNGCAP